MPDEPAVSTVLPPQRVYLPPECRLHSICGIHMLLMRTTKSQVTSRTVQAENALMFDYVLYSLPRTFKSSGLVLETNLDKLERDHLGVAILNSTA